MESTMTENTIGVFGPQKTYAMDRSTPPLPLSIAPKYVFVGGAPGKGGPVQGGPGDRSRRIQDPWLTFI